MNIIIFIMSCERDRNNGWNDAVRETYLKTWGDRIQHKFLIGGGSTGTISDGEPHIIGRSGKPPQEDELFLAVDDSYNGLSQKVRAAYRWANCRYDYIFQAMGDTYVAVPRLLASGFEQHDYTGCVIDIPPYVGGGSGYCLSRRAYSIIASNQDENIPIWDDLWIGNVLRDAGIAPHNDMRYWTDAHLVNGIAKGGGGAFPSWEQYIWDTGILATHLGRNTNQFKPLWMQECHKSFLKNARGGYGQ